MQLKLTDFETRLAHLERLSDEFEGKSTVRSLPFPSPFFLCLMSSRRPFVAPRSTRTKRLGSQTQTDKVGDVSSPLKTGIGNQEEGYDQTPISE